MMQVQVNRNQWPVGHGFFHTGRVTAGTATVRYVYDCGSSHVAKHRKSVIDLARAEDSADIDLFFVSHFDADHVLGIPDLIRGRDVQVFLIPWSTPAMRLAQVVSGALDARNQQGIQLLSSMVADPVLTLQGLGGRGEPDSEQPRSTVVIVGEVARDGDDLDPPLLSITRVELDDQSIIEAHVNARTGRTTLTRTRPAGSKAELWVWDPFALTSLSQANGTLRSASKAFFSALVKQKVIKRTESLSDAATVRSILEDKQKRETTKKVYQDLSVGTTHRRSANLSSLMLYNGPPPEAPTWSCAFWIDETLGLHASSRMDRNDLRLFWPNRYERTHPSRCACAGAGWLAFGDADFLDRDRALDAVRHYRRYAQHVGTLCPSHHGAPLDWRPELLSLVNQARCFYTVFGAAPSGTSYPLRGRHGHPGADPLVDTISHGGTPVIVSQHVTSEWREDFVTEVYP